MLTELTSKEKVVGVKQLKKALRDNKIAKVFFAEDADPTLLAPIITLCWEQNIPMEGTPTMVDLGRACGIQVGAAVAALLNP